MHLFATVLAALTIPAVAICQQAPPATIAKEASKRPPFVFEAGNVELATLIERCASYLGRNILFESDDVISKAGPAMVSLQLPVVTDPDGCEELLSSLLWRRGLAIVPLDGPKGVYEILAMNGPQGHEIAMRAVQRTPEQVMQRPSLHQWVVVAYELQHANATIATNALRPFFASTGRSRTSGALIIGNVGTSRAILLNGPQNVVANALLILKAADVPPLPEARPHLAARVDALAKQNERLLARLLALEKQLGKAGR